MAQVNGNGVAKTAVSSVARDKGGVYVPSRALELIPEVIPILHMFLRGQMREADEMVKNGDPASETLYYSIGMNEPDLQNGSHVYIICSLCRTMPHRSL
jgi:hypothetical protein